MKRLIGLQPKKTVDLDNYCASGDCLGNQGELSGRVQDGSACPSLALSATHLILSMLRVMCLLPSLPVEDPAVVSYSFAMYKLSGICLLAIPGIGSK